MDPKDLDAQSVYKLLIGSVVPRPIAWTSTVSKKGIRNLAPFSFFTVASRNRFTTGKGSRWLSKSER
jgi:flavin reductase (DIM6/NTAB) family NADH-FMN oxidoreductase RutF